MNVRQVLPPDAIPSVDDPTYEPVADYPHDADDEVVVLDGDPPRAFPIRYLNYHEIVNAAAPDGTPVAVTWCPLCGSAVAYERVVDGREQTFGVSASDASGGSNDSLVLSFGVSGKLADDDLVMYDRETDSEWKQSLGEAIAGPLEGTDLTVLPAAMTTVARFAADHPDGRVMARPGGESEAAGPGDEPEPIEYADDPYREYVESEGFGLDAHRGSGGSREWDRDDLEPKAVVLGVERDGDALGFPLERVEAAGGVATATVGGDGVAAFATPDGIHAFANPGLEFAPTDEPGRFGADGAVWDGATGESDDGRGLARLPARRLFAFAWQDDHGPDAFWSVE
jgi:hypothetical protein